MARGTRPTQYPDSYGKPTAALPDVLGPLNVDNEGDILVPPNDMLEVADGFSTGSGDHDPLGLMIFGDGTKT